MKKRCYEYLEKLYNKTISDKPVFKAEEHEEKPVVFEEEIRWTINYLENRKVQEVDGSIAMKF